MLYINCHLLCNLPAPPSPPLLCNPTWTGLHKHRYLGKKHQKKHIHFHMCFDLLSTCKCSLRSVSRLSFWRWKLSKTNFFLFIFFRICFAEKTNNNRTFPWLDIGASLALQVRAHCATCCLGMRQTAYRWMNGKVFWEYINPRVVKFNCVIWMICSDMLCVHLDESFEMTVGFLSFVWFEGSRPRILLHNKNVTIKC